MRALRLALAFLTRLPHPEGDDGSALPAATGWFPVAGAVVGAGAIAGMAAGSASLGPLPGSVAALATGWWLTRGFHLDGLSDCFDGLLCNGDRDRRLAVMRDPRAGGLGAASIAVWVVARVAVLHTTIEAGTTLWALWAAAVLARAPLAWELLRPPATPGRGLYATLHAGVGARQVAVSLALTAALVGPLALVSPVRLAAAVLLAGCGTLLWHRAWVRILGGLTGDILGAGVELRELLILGAFATPLLPP